MNKWFDIKIIFLYFSFLFLGYWTWTKHDCFLVSFDAGPDGIRWHRRSQDILSADGTTKFSFLKGKKKMQNIMGHLISWASHKLKLFKEIIQSKIVERVELCLTSEFKMVQ